MEKTKESNDVSEHTVSSEIGSGTRPTRTAEMRSGELGTDLVLLKMWEWERDVV